MRRKKRPRRARPSTIRSARRPAEKNATPGDERQHVQAEQQLPERVQAEARQAGPGGARMRTPRTVSPALQTSIVPPRRPPGVCAGRTTSPGAHPPHTATEMTRVRGLVQRKCHGTGRLFHCLACAIPCNREPGGDSPEPRARPTFVIGLADPFASGLSHIGTARKYPRKDRPIRAERQLRSPEVGQSVAGSGVTPCDANIRKS